MKKKRRKKLEFLAGQGRARKGGKVRKIFSLRKKEKGNWSFWQGKIEQRKDEGRKDEEKLQLEEKKEERNGSFWQGNVKSNERREGHGSLSQVWHEKDRGKTGTKAGVYPSSRHVLKVQFGNENERDSKV